MINIILYDGISTDFEGVQILARRVEQDFLFHLAHYRVFRPGRVPEF